MNQISLCLKKFSFFVNSRYFSEMADIFEEICIKIFNQIDLKITESENLTIIRQNLLASFK